MPARSYRRPLLQFRTGNLIRHWGFPSILSSPGEDDNLNAASRGWMAAVSDYHRIRRTALIGVLLVVLLNPGPALLAASGAAVDSSPLPPSISTAPLSVEQVVNNLVDWKR